MSDFDEFMQDAGTENKNYILGTMPKNQSELIIADYIHIMGPKPMPNIWFRFWYKFLLGWKWRKINE